LVIYDFIQQFLAQNTNHCFCLSVSNPGINLVEIHRMFWSNPGTNLVQIHYMFKFSLQICSHVPNKRPHLSAISKMVFQWSSWIFTMQTFTFLYVRPVEGQLEHSKSSTKFPQSSIKKPIHKSLFSPWNCQQKLF
jgi:hypothetical protein